MRTGRVPLAYLLLVLASPVLQVSCDNDLYWPGEEYASNEFLEMKQEEPTVLDSLKRLKRQWDDFSDPFNAFAVFREEAGAETATEVPDDTGSNGNDDAALDIGSGVPKKTESEPEESIRTIYCDLNEFSCDGATACLPMSVKCNGQIDCRDRTDEMDCPVPEKNFQITFQIMEPYITAYSNKNSLEFGNLSRSLSIAVSSFYESLPGSPQSSVEIIRIQPLVNDDFICKVTCDIWITSYEDTDTIKDILRNHIKNNGRLGDTFVRYSDVSEQLIEPDTVPVNDTETIDTDATTARSNTDVCPPNYNLCDETRCVEQIRRCDGFADCFDGTDEAGCPPQDLRSSKKDLQEEIRQMHQEFQQLRTELSQLKDSIETYKCTGSKSKRPSVDDTIASVQWQLNELDQGLTPKDVEVTGIPEGKVITIKLSVSVADAERARPIRHKPVEKSGRSISLSVSADPVAHRSRSISASLNRRQ